MHHEYPNKIAHVMSGDADAGIANVSAEHYEGSHWLASFATYLVTKPGM